MENFEKLKLKTPLLRSIEDEGFIEPSEIQEKTIPYVLEGKDVIAGAATGSGKTLAFGSGILQNCKKESGTQALVLTPTRELAEQITKTLSKFSKYYPLNISAVYGGVSINPQIDNLEYANVVIGTPGRILDHISRRTIDLSKIKILVLDEADRMLDMGFKDDVEKIIFNCPKNRQTLLFSATITPDISLLSRKYMRNPIEISAETYIDKEKLTQIYYDVEDDLKYSLLKHLLQNEESKLVMVFCNTRKNVDFIAINLKHHGINALPIHGGFSQDKRNRIINQFHSQNIHVLVCTDVAARGLDIKGISHIYNYDIPKDSKEYIHRIGRTARAGKEGKVINIVTGRDYENFSNVLKDENLEIKRAETPLVNRERLRYLPERRENRNQGFNRQNRFNNRGNNIRNNNRRDNNKRNNNRFNRPRNRSYN